MKVFYLLITFMLVTAQAYAVSQAQQKNEQHLGQGHTVATPDEIGGRVLTILTHPDVQEKMWAGTTYGGLWYSPDAGHSWKLASELMENMAVGALAVDPRNTDVIYAGTGDGRKRGGGSAGNGMFKTVDGGINWLLLPLTNPATVGENWSHISYIAISTAGVVLAATSDYKRNGFIFRSVDGGQTWGLLPVYSGSKVGPRNMIHKVRFDPANPNTAIFMDDYANVTHSSDSGVSWNMVKKSSTCK